MVNILEPPSRTTRGQKISKLLESAPSAFAGFGQKTFDRLEKFRLMLGDFIFDIESRSVQWKSALRRHGINRSLSYKFLIVAAIALLPVVDKVTAEDQAYEDVIHYTQTLDPIESARYAAYFSGYTPGLYVDADQVALNAIANNSSYTLQQQLAVNEGKEFSVEGRQDPTYELKSGETIADVAKKFDLHVGTLVDANGLDPVNLKSVKPGTTLIIPSSDTNTSNDWLVAINKAEDEKRKKAAEEAAKKKLEQQRLAAASNNTRATGTVAGATTARRQVSSEVTVIGTSYEQCVVWARENSGIGIHGYAGNIAATQSEPRVGGIALDRFYGHASVVVSVGDDYIVVHEANWIHGKITERRVSRDAIRGYVY